MKPVRAAAGPTPATPVSFWETPRHGANCQTRGVTPAYWTAAREAGLAFVRLLPNAWPASRRDFLIGDADHFTALEERDLERLRAALDDAHRAGVPVVLGMISLPGARWRQLNGDRDDARLWRDASFRPQAASFWRQLASRLRGHPALVAYNPLNEPHPERAFGVDDEGDDAAFVSWRARAPGGPADLDDFNREIVAAIREGDPDTPILLDGWMYASPAGLSHLAVVADPAVLYAFHFYQPWSYTTFRVNRGRFSYPERMPVQGATATIHWGAEGLAAALTPVERWARANAIPPGRIVAAELGVDRRVSGAQQYLADLVSALCERGWHWAFYSFRSDGAWTGLDYELGTDPVDPRIWDAEQRGEDVERYKRRHPNPLWDILTRELGPHAH